MLQRIRTVTVSWILRYGQISMVSQAKCPAGINKWPPFQEVVVVLLFIADIFSSERPAAVTGSMCEVTCRVLVLSSVHLVDPEVNYDSNGRGHFCLTVRRS
ncbi:hypothetical protein JB92DRAFT_2983365 [Gautieria morchelliformis]|nr:hypothetical protein JB92DRAFT_2983365 [Gautieria morchelliformis]